MGYTIVVSTAVFIQDMSEIKRHKIAVIEDGTGYWRWIALLRCSYYLQIIRVNLKFVAACCTCQVQTKSYRNGFCRESIIADIQFFICGRNKLAIMILEDSSHRAFKFVRIKPRIHIKLVVVTSRSDPTIKTCPWLGWISSIKLATYARTARLTWDAFCGIPPCVCFLLSHHKYQQQVAIVSFNFVSPRIWI